MKYDRHNISVHKQAGEASKPEEMYYRLLFEHCDDAVFLTSPDGSIYSANPAACRMFQRTEAEICSVGRNDLIDPDDPRMPAALEERERTGRFKGELTCLLPDGRKFPCELSSVVFRDQDGHFRTSTIIHDITEHKRLEEALKQTNDYNRNLIEASLDPLVIIGPDGTITDLNTATETVTGHTRRELIGTCFSDYFSDPEKARTGYKMVFTKGSINGYELEIRHRDGHLTPVLYNASLFKDTTGKAAGIFAAARDITDRKLVEERLRESESRYKELFEYSGTSIVIVDRDGKYLMVNRVAAERFGRSEEEIIGKSMFDLLPQVMANKYLKANRKLLDVGGHREYEDTFTLSTGKKVFLIVDQCLKDAQGNNFAIQSSAIDITERKRAEETLREDEELFRLLAEQSLMAIGIIQDGIFKYFNKAFEEINGYSADEIKRWEPFEFSNTFHPEDRDFVTDQIRKKQAGNPDVVLNYPFRIMRKNGEMRWVEIYSRTVTYKNKPADLVTIVDITGSKKNEEALIESEERYRIITENTIAGVYLVQDGLLRYVNPSFCKIHGYAKDELVGKLNTLDLVVEEEKEFLKNKMKERFSGEKQSEQFSIKIRRKNGEIRFLEVLSSYALYAGKPAVLGTCIDMTEVRRANEAIKRSREELRSLTAYLQNIRERERIQIAREIHDELGQSLTGIMIDISWLKKKLADTVKPTGPIEAKISSLLALTESTIAKTRELSLSLRPGILDDLGLVTAINWQLKRFQEKTGIICMLQSDVAEATIPADYSTVLFRISQECLTNISRYADATKVKITFTGEGESLVLEIEDNGKGITTEQIRNPLSLGILGMRERVMSFRGRFSISGKPGRGTKVRVEVPIR